MINIPHKQDPSFLITDEENQYINELQNSIRGTGITPSETDTSQTAQAISIFVQRGCNFIETYDSVANIYKVRNEFNIDIIGTYQDGMIIYVKISNTNTGASTIQIGNMGIKPITNQDGTDLAPSTLTRDDMVELVYHDIKNRFEYIPKYDEASGFTTGYIVPTMNKSRPDGWCFISETIGSINSQADYKGNDCVKLWRALYSGWDDDHCKVIGGRTNIDDDWKSNKPITVFNDVTRRSLSTGYSQGDYWTGKKFGEDTFILSIYNLFPHNHDIEEARIQLRTQASSGQQVVLEAGAGFGNAKGGTGGNSGHFRDNVVWHFIKAMFNSSDSCSGQPIRKINPVFYYLFLCKF